MTVMDRIAIHKLLPVIKIEEVEDALPLAEALIEGGLPVAEITFRTDCAAEAIAIIKKNHPDMLVGAGTVLTVEQVKLAVAAGAEFIVSPGANPVVIRYCTENNIPIVPGCVTPSEIEMAMQYGLNTVKFFPAETYGGIKAIKALSAPYRHLRFVPTGGINESNIANYLSCKSVVACGGSFMVSQDLINAGKFNEIRDMTARAVSLIESICT